MNLDLSSIENRRWRRLAEMAPQAGQGPYVPSPCQSVCVMHPRTGWCEGCMRTLDEIAAWTGMERAQRLACWADLPDRLAQRIALEKTR